MQYKAVHLLVLHFFKNKMDNKGRLVKNLPDAVVEEKPSKL